MDGHISLATECQISDVLRINNGDVVRLAPGNPKIVAGVKVGRLGIKKGKIVSLEPKFTDADIFLS